MNRIILFFFVLTLLMGCKDKSTEPLPFLGKPKIVNGEQVIHQVPDWSYIDQDSQAISNKSLNNSIYVTDFFFRSCPSICPKVMREMKRIYEEFKGNEQVKLVSFTLDPKRDTPEKLKAYAANLEVNTDQWKFVHTDAETVFDLANEHMIVAYADDEAPGGFDHSGNIILVDKKGHIRSFSLGTDPTQTPKLIEDIKILLKEYE